AITIATNMAGRGTDIKLGGSLDMRILQETAGITDEAEKAGRIERIKADIERFRDIVLKAEDVVEVEPAKGSRPAKTVTKPGGLYIVGTERHESRRIDNQLRGRCARQGDPGSTQFFLALDDELLRLFGSDKIAPLMERLGMQEGEVIESGLVSYQIENAQRRVETHNFDIRKQLLDYDNVMNKQREVVYSLRDNVLFGSSVSLQVRAMIEED